LEVARRLAAPCPLCDLLSAVVDAGRDVLQADRGSVFLYDHKPHELYMITGTGLEALRFCADHGLAGQCASSRDVLNIPNCYADTRFNQEIDRKTGYRTNCMITVPLVGLEDKLVGVMQMLNAQRGHFDDEDEQIALALAGQAAVAIQRAQLLTEQQVKIRMEQDLNLARDIQLGVLPTELPAITGYDIATFSQPADQTGGDIFDVVRVGEDEVPTDPVLIMLADATGHGIGPALSVTQMRAMFRMGLRLGADLCTLRQQIDHQLEEDLGSSRFITAFFGSLDPQKHTITYEAPGQAPLLCYHAADDRFETRDASGLPLGIMASIPHDVVEPFALEPGDIFILLTDGFFECHNTGAKEMFGEEGVMNIVRSHRDKTAGQIIEALVAALYEYAPNEPQADDWTAIIIKRLP
jgi:phosphoserine phosphatase